MLIKYLSKNFVSSQHCYRLCLFSNRNWGHYNQVIVELGFDSENLFLNSGVHWRNTWNRTKLHLMVLILLVIHSVFLNLGIAPACAHTESEDVLFFFLSFGLDVLSGYPPVESGSSPVCQKTSKVILSPYVLGLCKEYNEMTSAVSPLSSVF